VMIYEFIASQKAEFPIVMLCRVCEVSRSTYSAWAFKKHSGALCEEVQDEAYLANEIFNIWKKSKRRYGAPRVAHKLWDNGVHVSYKKVARIMAQIGISGICGRRKLITTRRDPSHLPASDLVMRNFNTQAPDELWVGDITYIATREGWMYVASVIDVYSRRLIGWSIDDHMMAELCTRAICQAAQCRKRSRFAGTIFHSDKGCQYTSNDFAKQCAAMGIVQSMGTKGDSYDNALAESFWSSLKRELDHDGPYETKQQARAAIFEWIMWYNNERLHSSLGYVCPAKFEAMMQDRIAA